MGADQYPPDFEVDPDGTCRDRRPKHPSPEQEPKHGPTSSPTSGQAAPSPHDVRSIVLGIGLVLIVGIGFWFFAIRGGRWSADSDATPPSPPKSMAESIWEIERERLAQPTQGLTGPLWQSTDSAASGGPMSPRLPVDWAAQPEDNVSKARQELGLHPKRPALGVDRKLLIRLDDGPEAKQHYLQEILEDYSQLKYYYRKDSAKRELYQKSIKIYERELSEAKSASQ